MDHYFRKLIEWETVVTFKEIIHVLVTYGAIVIIRRLICRPNPLMATRNRYMVSGAAIDIICHRRNVFLSMRFTHMCIIFSHMGIISSHT